MGSRIIQECNVHIGEEAELLLPKDAPIGPLFSIPNGCRFWVEIDEDLERVPRRFILDRPGWLYPASKKDIYRGTVVPSELLDKTCGFHLFELKE